jgi:hypothetical protein
LTIFCASDYVVRTSIQDVITILKMHGDKAKILAGVTTIYELACGPKLPANSDYSHTAVVPTAI